MTSQERVLLALDHKEADRVAIHDAPWGTTIERWHREGLPEDQSPAEYFGYEFASVGADTSFQLPSETVEETEEYTLVRNGNGALRRNWKHRTSTPEMIEFTVTSREKWEELKPRMQMNDTRVDWENARKTQEAARTHGKFFCYSGAIGYDKTQGIVGSERLLMAMITDPDWVKDMFMTGAQVLIDAAEEMMGKGFTFDAAFLYDDMGYRNASLFSPQMYRELLFPAHRMAFQFFRGKGLPVLLHSCGRVSGLVPQLIEAGLSCLQPLEVKAGMDLIQLKKDCGDRLAFMGGIDVRKMAAQDPAEIEEEIRTKFEVAMKDGGYIYHSDHSVPDNVSFAQYKRVMELVHHYGRYT